MKDAVGELATHRILLYFVLLSIMFLIGAVVLSTQAQQLPTPLSQVDPMQTPIVSVTNDSRPVQTTTGSQMTPTIALATPWGVLGLDPLAVESIGTETASSTPIPDLSPIVLLGPPAGSQFMLGDMVTFYWDWPEDLRKDLRFSVQLQANNQTMDIGTAEAENLGTVQQLGVVLGDVGVEAGDYQWLVVIEESDSGTVLARSEQRPIVLLPDGNR